MAKYKYILTVIITLCTLITYAQPAQYTPMTAAGYQMKRLKVDSTLHLPSFCGIPTLRGSSAKEGALAIDTCGGFLFIWTNENGWDTIGGSGGGTSTDTTSLSNRINLKIDSIRRVSDSVFAWINGTAYFQYTDSIVGGGDFWKTNGTTILSGTVTIGNNGIINFFGANEDLQKFNVNALDVQFDGGVYKFTSMTSLTDTSTYKPLGIDASTGKLAPLTYWVSGGTTIDTTNQFVKRLDRIPGKDSIIYFVGGTRYAIKDSVGGGSSQNGRFGNDTATVVMVKVHNESGTILTNGKVVAFSTSGTQSNEPAVKLANNKHDSTSANTLGFVSGTIAINDTGWVILSGKIEKLNTSAFSNGDIIYLDSINGLYTSTKPVAPYHMVYLGVVVKSNSGNGSIYVKCQNGYELNEIHDVKITSPLNNQVLAYSDTQRLWKNRNIYSIVDTTVFQRKSIPSYTFLANNTPSTANAQALTFKDTSGTYTGTPTWSTSAPIGTTNHSYRWTRIGNMVTLTISLVYGTASAANTTVLIPLPSDAPTPVKPAGLTAASNFLYPAYSNSGNTLTAAQITGRGGIRSNSGNNGFEIFINFTTLQSIYFQTTVTYYTN